MSEQSKLLIEPLADCRVRLSIRGRDSCEFPKTWPIDREQRARIIGEWLQTEARFLA
jgi:hypothetical protein